MLHVEIIYLTFIVNRLGISFVGEKERCIYIFIFYAFKVLMLQEMMPVRESKGQIRKHQRSGKFYYLGLFKDRKEIRIFFFF